MLRRGIWQYKTKATIFFLILLWCLYPKKKLLPYKQTIPNLNVIALKMLKVALLALIIPKLDTTQIFNKRDIGTVYQYRRLIITEVRVCFNNSDQQGTVIYNKLNILLMTG